MILKIDPEFKNLIPSLSKEEYEGLEYNIKVNGFDPLYPIIVWDRFIIDGHNRYEICQNLKIDPPVVEKEFDSRIDAVNWIIDNQLNRRNINNEQRTYLIGKRYKKEKKTVGRPKEEDKFRHCDGNNETAEKIAAQSTVSPRTVERAEKFAEAIDKVAENIGINPQKILSGEIKATQKDIKEVANFEPEKQRQIFDKVQNDEVKTLKEAINEVEFEEILVNDLKPDTKKSVFNFTNDSIEWAKWTWNPVTGCKYGCPYCYAKDMAIRFYHHFEPTFYEERLDAPKNTKVPEEAATDIGFKNVFVCSMADLFGPWISDEWIEKVLDVCRKNPQWNYLFLTKNPMRLIGIEFPDNAWVGTTVDVQKRVEPAKEAFIQVKAKVKFLSCEPLQEHLIFDDMSMFDWLIIGGRSKSSGMPEGQPEWKWVEELLIQARKNDVSAYFKPNLKVRPNEYPEQSIVT